MGEIILFKLLLMQAKYSESGEGVAIKKVLQDKIQEQRAANYASFDHPNVVSLKHCFFLRTDILIMNTALEYGPETAHRVIRNIH